MPGDTTSINTTSTSTTALTIATTAFADQKPGTSGLRKRVTVFQQPGYTENFIQSILNSILLSGGGSGGSSGGSSNNGNNKGATTLVVGGDGRFYVREVVQLIVSMCAANGVARLLVAQNGLLSTPAASNLIRKYGAVGGIILTASHNPGGPQADFGIKYNTANGGPAPEQVTNLIYENSKKIQHYLVTKDYSPIDLSTLKTHTVGGMRVDVIDSVHDYVDLMKEIFDFSLIRSFFQKWPAFTVLVDAMNGVTGPYMERIFVQELGLPDKGSVRNSRPLPDFGGLHPDPNLTYAKDLVDEVKKRAIDFAAAADGDGDRAMFLDHRVFINPCDSVALLAEYAHCIPYFKKAGLLGLARSMPTSAALDRVAKAKGVPVFETPTGWKFFGNLLDAGKISICGEESFGAGSNHIREKDGIWAMLMYLNILAAENQAAQNQTTTTATTAKPAIDFSRLIKNFYVKYGRHFFTRYDYEDVESEGANKLMDYLNGLIAEGKMKGTQLGAFTVATMDNFAYTDPVDGSVTKNQGVRVLFEDGSRIVYRLSGTGSSGATIRVYMEQYSKQESQYEKQTSEVIGPIIAAAVQLSRMEEFTGRREPSVIT